MYISKKNAGDYLQSPVKQLIYYV